MSSTENHSFVLPEESTHAQEKNDNGSTLEPIVLDLSTLGPIALDLSTHDCDYNTYNNWLIKANDTNNLIALSSGTQSALSDNTNGYVILAGYNYESEGGHDTYGYSKTLDEAKQIATESITTGKKNKYKQNKPLDWTHVVNLDTLTVIYKLQK